MTKKNSPKYVGCYCRLLCSGKRSQPRYCKQLVIDPTNSGG